MNSQARQQQAIDNLNKEIRKSNTKYTLFVFGVVTALVAGLVIAHLAIEFMSANDVSYGY
jgi:hypothetical protein